MAASSFYQDRFDLSKIPTSNHTQYFKWMSLSEIFDIAKNSGLYEKIISSVQPPRPSWRPFKPLYLCGYILKDKYYLRFPCGNSRDFEYYWENKNNGYEMLLYVSERNLSQIPVVVVNVISRSSGSLRSGSALMSPHIPLFYISENEPIPGQQYNDCVLDINNIPIPPNHRVYKIMSPYIVKLCPMISKIEFDVTGKVIISSNDENYYHGLSEYDGIIGYDGNTFKINLYAQTTYNCTHELVEIDKLEYHFSEGLMLTLDKDVKLPILKKFIEVVDLQYIMKSNDFMVKFFKEIDPNCIFRTFIKRTGLSWEKKVEED